MDIDFLIIYIKPGHWPNEYNIRQWARRPGFNSRSSHTKDSKMVLDASLLNSQHYQVWIKGKVEQSMERSRPYNLV